MVKRYVVYAANCICDAPPNSDGQYVLVADYAALAARLAEAEELLQDFYDYGYDQQKCGDFLAADSASVVTESK